MKIIISILFIAVASFCNAQDIPKISPEQAKNYVGKTVTVCGKIDDVFVSIVGNVFFNFGGSYPNQKFTIYFYSNEEGESNKHFEEYKGKTICATGVVKLDNKKPEIQLESRNDFIVQ